MTGDLHHRADARSGPRIRPATPADYPAFAGLHPELGPEFPVPSEAEWTGGLVEKAIFAESDGGIAGYALGTPFGKLGHVSQLVVGPGWRRSGIGRVLMAQLAARFQEMGCDQWQLNVKRQNLAARALYERLGFARVSTCSWITLSPESISRLPSMECVVRPLALEDDELVERTFDLRTGQMAWSRSHAGALLHEVFDAGERIGVGIYVQASRFVVPLRLRRQEALAPLLASFPGAREQGARIAVEEDEELAALALRCGGTVDLETDRLVGPLPLTRG